MVQLCKKTVEFPLVQHIDQIVAVAVTMRDSSHRPGKLKGSSISQLCHSVTRDSCVETPCGTRRTQTRGSRRVMCQWQER